jgi:ketosteroid isomerase-like protein
MPYKSGLNQKLALVAVGIVLLVSAPTFAQAEASKSSSDVFIPDSVKTVTGNKKLVLDTWLAFWRGDVEAGLANMTDDVTWFNPTSLKVGGMINGKDALRKFRKTVEPHGSYNIFLELHTRIVGIYGDGNTVVLEDTGAGRLKNGQAYENETVKVVEIENGKIKHVREYADTAKAMAVNALVPDHGSSADH